MPRKMTKEDFVSKARNIHGDKFNYDKVVYTGSKNMVTITCPVHGDFQQRPGDHMAGHGCRSCGGNPTSTEQFIIESKAIFGDKFDYSKTKYVRGIDKVIITCKKHGDFSVTPGNHLQKKDCPKCALEKRSIKSNSKPEEKDK